MKSYASVGLLVLLIVVGVYANHKQNAFSKARIEELLHTQKEMENLHQALVDMHEMNKQSIFNLLTAHQDIKGRLSEQQQETKRLQNEVQEVKKWANSGLPSDIIRLRQRPALIGAEPYHSLPAGNSLHIKPKQPTD